MCWDIFLLLVLAHTHEADTFMIQRRCSGVVTVKPGNSNGVDFLLQTYCWVLILRRLLLLGPNARITYRHWWESQANKTKRVKISGGPWRNSVHVRTFGVITIAVFGSEFSAVLFSFPCSHLTTINNMAKVVIAGKNKKCFLKQNYADCLCFL